MDWTSLNSDKSFLLLGPGTAVTREGVAGSWQFKHQALGFEWNYEVLTWTIAWLTSLLAPWNHGCPGEGNVKPVTECTILTTSPFKTRLRLMMDFKI